MNEDLKQSGGKASPSLDCSPLSAGELIEMAIHGKPIRADRVLATFAQESNWVQIYHGETSPAADYKAKACEWAFVGPSRPPYELAQWALKFLRENAKHETRDE